MSDDLGERLARMTKAELVAVLLETWEQTFRFAPEVVDVRDYCLAQGRRQVLRWKIDAMKAKLEEQLVQCQQAAAAVDAAKAGEDRRRFWEAYSKVYRESDQTMRQIDELYDRASALFDDPWKGL